MSAKQIKNAPEGASKLAIVIVASHVWIESEFKVIGCFVIAIHIFIVDGFIISNPPSAYEGLATSYVSQDLLIFLLSIQVFSCWERSINGRRLSIHLYK